jgi:hypothetical protein
MLVFCLGQPSVPPEKMSINKIRRIRRHHYDYKSARFHQNYTIRAENARFD